QENQPVVRQELIGSGKRRTGASNTTVSHMPTRIIRTTITRRPIELRLKLRANSLEKNTTKLRKASRAITNTTHRRVRRFHGIQSARRHGRRGTGWQE